MGHRPEIDGLRALAVVPVVLFHADLFWFTGGFVGVDVFFVISGYLITAILMRDASRPGHFAAFYERRARRILPALFPILIAGLVGAWYLFVPLDFRHYSQAVAATALFASNMLFALQNDYFGGEEGFEPLIHGWSLSVEEQFYFIYPVLLLALIRFRPRAILPTIAGILFASFALALVLAETSPRFAFNLLPTRAWELLAGAVCAVLPPVLKTRQLPGLAGIALIVTGMVVIGPDTPVPGVAFLLPVVGTALVVRYATTGSIAAQILGWRPFVLIGLISYGLYLWHQVLLAFVFYTTFGAPSRGVLAATIAMSTVLAAVSYKWIEQPVRRKQFLKSRTTLIAFCSAGLLAAIGLGVAGHLAILEPRSGPDARRFDAVYPGGLASRAIPAGKLAFVLYGDSHARQYENALQTRLGRGALLGENACIALPDISSWQSGEERQPCIDQYDAMQRLVAERSVPVVIWAQRWESELFANADARPLGSGSGPAEPVLRSQLEQVRRTLPAGTRLIILGNTPGARASAPQMADGLLRCRAYRNVTCPTIFDRSYAEGAKMNAILRAFAAETPGVTYIDTAQLLCRGDKCPILDGDRLYYHDGDHVTAYSANIVADRVASVVRSD
ncbi:acyltransferase family protein [Altererythrobacter aerius]|uniref:Acyltransferase family protein n=1 Tax=Tsuneonella aeria TaxID=1837929 RepID=A0A6I4T8J3_9SPHN|nr:acyltransferase family protein [Tsuneonella aeria]MXO73889.1 acyltransferase family protein [Tsuneonella aeria]